MDTDGTRDLGDDRRHVNNDVGDRSNLLIFFGLKTSPLPSERRTIAAYSGPDRLAILSPRSSFAEFNNGGKIAKMESFDDLAAWIAPTDGVLVRKDK